VALSPPTPGRLCSHDEDARADGVSALFDEVLTGLALTPQEERGDGRGNGLKAHALQAAVCHG